MLDFIVALLPAIGLSLYVFGSDAFKVLAAATLSSVLAEFFYEYLMKRKLTYGDGTAAVTGLLLGLCLPAGVPLYIPIIGGIFATLVVVQLFGGYGQHFINPALVSRCFLLISFKTVMTTYQVDGVSTATPLAIARSGGTVTWQDLLTLNEKAGCIGEVSVIALLIGALYLLIRRKISLVTPAVYLLAFSVFMILFGGRGADGNYLLAQLFGGGLIFAAFFFATDRVTSPVGIPGKIVYGIVLGLITGIYRVLGSETESVSFAVIFCNLLVPLIDKAFAPKPCKEEAA